MNKFQIVIDGRLFDVIPHQKATFKIYEGDKLISELSALSNFKGSFYWSNRDEDADERFDKLVGKAIEAYFPRGVNADMIDTGLYRMNIFVENMSEPFKISIITANPLLWVMTLKKNITDLPFKIMES
jgi:hypothetical protein